MTIPRLEAGARVARVNTVRSVSVGNDRSRVAQ
jgi:hypothetical protein